MKRKYIAVDLGGTNMRVARFDSEVAEPNELVKLPTEASQGPDAVIHRMITTIESVMDQADHDWRIGVGVPGPLDPREGLVYGAPNLPGWDDVPLQAKLESHFGVPAAIGNDANLAALGEWSHGAGQGSNDIIFLTISTGIGGGVISDGHLIIGANGVGAELGHIVIEPNGPRCGCGRYGHLEAIASGTAIARNAQQRLAAGATSSLAEIDGEISAADVGAAAQAGDQLALELVHQAAENIGQGLADFCHIFNPEIYVLGGGVSQLGELLFEPIRASLNDHLMHPIYGENLKIVPAALGDDAGLVGAMVLAASL